MVTRRKRGGHRVAVDQMVEALATGPQHAALVEACRSLADAVDAVTEFDDRLWREYRFTLRALLERASGGSHNDDFDAEFESLRTEVGNSADT